MKNKSKNKKTKLLIGLLVLLLVISGGGYYLYQEGYFGERGQVTQPEDIPKPEPIPEPETLVEPTYDTILPKYEELYNKNNDFVGWINVPKTNIDYPIMQSTDNEFYLHRDFDKKYIFDGIPFMDFRNVLQPDMHDNTLIYGHNMGQKGNMFTELIRYRNIDFYKKAPVIQLDTIYREAQWKVVGVYDANTDPRFGPVFEYYNFVVAQTQEDLDWYLDQIEKRSFYHTDVDVELGDKLVTIQTCLNDKYETKVLVVARRVRFGESPEVDVTKAVLNPNRVLPR